MARPDLLQINRYQRKSLIQTGEIDAKKDSQGNPQGGLNSPMHCVDCGTRLLLVHIKPEPTNDRPKQWNGTFWCLNGECDSFCTDVTLTVE